MSLFSLIAATYFIVSGGPYGLEELVASAGLDRSVIVLLITPVVWSLPTALAVAELSAALPSEGGYYAWVRRGLGPFWGFQEAWLSLAASAFDMAIYPTLFVLYLGQLVPALGEGLGATLVGLGVIWGAAAINLRGAEAVGRSSMVVGVALVAPFAVLAALGFGQAQSMPASAAPSGWLAGVTIAMWNFMGWDNASTFATSVDRPQRTYPRAMLGAVALVTLTYLVPVVAMRFSGLSVSQWSTGSWATAAISLGGHWLGLAIVLGGMASAGATFNALVLSYSRLPFALAQDGYLPQAFARTRRGVPWVSVVACALAWSACLGLGFRRLVEFDVVLYGLSLVLEFAALIALRVREPRLLRPFRVPGGVWALVALATPPVALLAIATVGSDTSWQRLTVLGALIAAGPAVFVLARRSAT
jgi:amino acid transporter